jgi:hypothetical protein
MKLTGGREMHMKMKTETWWGKGENRQGGSIKLDDDTRDGLCGLLYNRPHSVNSHFCAFFANGTVCFASTGVCRRLQKSFTPKVKHLCSTPLIPSLMPGITCFFSIQSTEHAA